ncbi:MAG TPA: Mur ligase domain-containing protein, partial [Thermoanaerobaculia bacterium]
MRLSELIAEIPSLRVDRIGAESADPEISGVTHDSRTVEPGDLYVALVGQRFDGRDFARDAVARGAVAVVVDETRALLAPLAAAVYGHPDRELILAGVTGTNG